MTNWYVSPSGSDSANGGTSWTVRSTNTDGVTNGTNTLTSAAAQFVAGDVGHGIFIGGVNQWRLVATFVSATEITFSGATIASASGRTWTIGGRFATVKKAGGIAGGAAGDIIYVAPGTYKELADTWFSGGNAYTTGTISVTNGSAVVTGSGTSWNANAFASVGFLKQSILASGTDGVTAGTTTFTSAAGNFQSGMIGKFIQINTKAAYQITAVASAISITLSGSPSVGSGLTYSVMTGEAPYRIASVDSDTQITLSEAWAGPTASALAYTTYKSVQVIGDYTGANTDGVGGLVRITGAAANEQTATRAQALTVATRSYIYFSGFLLDNGSSNAVQVLNGCTHITFDKCYMATNGTSSTFTISDASQSDTTLTNCFVECGQSNNVNIAHTSTIDNTAHVIKNCILHGNGINVIVNVQRIGGITITNCLLWPGRTGIDIQTALTVGQCVSVFNSTITKCNIGLRGTTASEIMSDYCNAPGNSTGYSVVAAGSHSNTFLFNPDSRWFFELTK